MGWQVLAVLKASPTRLCRHTRMTISPSHCDHTESWGLLVTALTTWRTDNDKLRLGHTFRLSHVAVMCILSEVGILKEALSHLLSLHESKRFKAYDFIGFTQKTPCVRVLVMSQEGGTQVCEEAVCGNPLPPSRHESKTEG